jgi:hypothetical protein
LSQEAKDLIDEVAVKGVCMHLVACNVSNREQVLQAMYDASSDGIVHGVLKFAESYQDIHQVISFDMMTAERFLRDQKSPRGNDFLTFGLFAMISSFGSVYTFPTQSTYPAANIFFDYLQATEGCMDYL